VLWLCTRVYGDRRQVRDTLIACQLKLAEYMNQQSDVAQSLERDKQDLLSRMQAVSIYWPIIAIHTLTLRYDLL